MPVKKRINTHAEVLPQCFDMPTLPPNWEEGWADETVSAPTSEKLTDLEESLISLGEPEGETSPSLDNFPTGPSFTENFPGAPTTQFPGGPSFSSRLPHVPTAYSFYLPFHLYRNRGWGIYLIAEPVRRLAQYFFRKTRSALDSRAEAFAATRLYLYLYEFFHHKAETFSAGRESDHRVAVYLQGQRLLHTKNNGKPEEALAEAYALDRMDKKLNLEKNWGWPDQKAEAFMDTLKGFIRKSPPRHQHGVDIYEKDLYEDVRNEFAEDILQTSPASVPSLPPEVWSLPNDSFRGLANVLSDVKYVIQVGQPLSRRRQLGLASSNTTQ
jgi:hypothetical protein